MIGPTCCVGDCCGPGSYCCGHPDNNHEHVLSVPAPLTVQLSARKSGKTQALIESLLAQAKERSLRVEVVYPETELAAPDDHEALTEAVRSTVRMVLTDAPEADADVIALNVVRAVLVSDFRRLTVTDEMIARGEQAAASVSEVVEDYWTVMVCAVLEAALGDTK